MTSYLALYEFVIGHLAINEFKRIISYIISSYNQYSKLVVIIL